MARTAETVDPVGKGGGQSSGSQVEAKGGRRGVFLPYSSRYQAELGSHFRSQVQLGNEKTWERGKKVPPGTKARIDCGISQAKANG